MAFGIFVPRLLNWSEKFNQKFAQNLNYEKQSREWWKNARESGFIILIIWFVRVFMVIFSIAGVVILVSAIKSIFFS
jgi:hypothetical protein